MEHKNFDNVDAKIGVKHIFYNDNLFFEGVIFIKVFFFRNIFKFIFYNPDWDHVIYPPRYTLLGIPNTKAQFVLE